MAAMENTENVAQPFGLPPRYQLLGLSFLALFLELMLIRWVPSSVRLVAYFANLMLISSFLGLGLGALVRAKHWNLYPLFPFALLLSFAFIYSSQMVFLPTNPTEFRFFQYGTPPRLIGYITLIGIFTLNTLVFVPIGEKIGELFHAMPPLQAYAWDLGGSFAGTICFGVFSFFAFSPIIGVGFVMLLYLLISQGRFLIRSSLAFLAALIILFSTIDSRAIWSPYYYITVQNETGTLIDISEVSPDIRTRENPETFVVRVNQDFYQVHGTTNPNRYTSDYPRARKIARNRARYLVPYEFKNDPGKVAIVGAGGGTDVEVAVSQGVESVDAVEIDPRLVDISRKISASGIYDDPHVNIVNDDARAFLERTNNKYDLIIFGVLDSQALFSSMSNVRLDGFVYTMESIRTAFSLLDDDGLLSVSFAAHGNEWLVKKLIGMMKQATDQAPLVYWDGGEAVLLAFRKPPMTFPRQIYHFERSEDFEGAHLDIPTDDWPYLYLVKKGIPTDYIIVIGTLLILSIASVVLLIPSGVHGSNRHFFFLGLGFLLLQTKSITACSLYFGATWFVTTLVVAGVLLMVFSANFVADKYLSGFRPVFYLPLFVTLLVVFFTPSDAILSLPVTGRMLWIVFAVPLPIFFAGLIFSTTFKISDNPSANLGANLIGATLGGFLEYLGMAIGHNLLILFIMGAYLCSFLTVRSPRSGSFR
jgi:hypothetical protein